MGAAAAATTARPLLLLLLLLLLLVLVLVLVVAAAAGAREAYQLCSMSVYSYSLTLRYSPQGTKALEESGRIDLRCLAAARRRRVNTPTLLKDEIRVSYLVPLLRVYGGALTYVVELFLGELVCHLDYLMVDV